mgnify:FL=1
MSIDKVFWSQSNMYDCQPQKKKEEDDFNPVEKTVVSTVAPARRLCDIPDMVRSGDTIAAIGLAGLTIVSLPEDCRDLKAAYNHSSCVLRKRRIYAPYNYHKYQHDFSFFRGTLLHEAMKRVKSERGKKIVDNLYKSDITLYNTKFGKWVQNILGIKNGKNIKSSIKNLYGQEVSVQKIIVKKDFLGLKELTGRAMKRTSLLGLAFMGLLELPKIIKSITKGDDAQEKTKSFAKQVGKSSLNVFGVTAGMGYIGAIGAKKYGALGSLIGMGLGVIAGAGASKWIQNQLKSEN